MLLLKGSMIYLTGVLASSTTLNHLRTKAVTRGNRASLGHAFSLLENHEIVRLSLLWPVSGFFVTAVFVAKIPLVYLPGIVQKQEEETDILKKEKEKL
jgi:hypothetical protein